MDLKVLDLALSGLAREVDTDSLDTQQKLRQSHTVDIVTRAYSRDFFDRQFEIQWEIAIRKKESVALFFIDVDQFRSFNAKNDSRSGDYALQKIAKTLRLLFRRASDFVARYKSDQFIILATDMTQEQAKVCARQICDRVRSLRILDRQTNQYLTVCVGYIVHMPLAAEKPQTVLEAAYQNLKNAKSSGTGKTFG